MNNWQERIKEVKQIAVGDIIANPQNAKLHPSKQKNAVRQSLETIGKAGVLMAYYSERNGGKLTLWDGHARQGLNPQEIWHVAITDLNDREADQMLLTYAPLLAMAEWDKQLTEQLLNLNDDLTGELMELASDIGDAAGVKYNVSDDAVEPEIDRAAELQSIWGTAHGQIWIFPSANWQGEHRIICGDNSKIETIAAVMQSDKATCVFTDPPYNSAIDHKNKALNRTRGGKRATRPILDDNLSADEWFEKLSATFKIVFANCLADDFTLFATAAPNLFGAATEKILSSAGFTVRHEIVWAKNAPVFSMGRVDYDYQHERIYMAYGKTHKRPMRGEHRKSVWFVDRPVVSKEHPTMKPVALYINAYLNHADKNDITFEPYSGSGTAIIASEKVGMYCRAVEIEPCYVAVALQRYQDTFGITPVLAT